MKTINFDKGNGLVPVIIQDANTQEVLMLGYMNSEAFDKTINTRNITFFSRSKNRLWTKGESSGNYLSLISYEIDCDSDTILMKAIPNGPTCHTGTQTCFGENTGSTGFIYKLEQIINKRIESDDPNSYTNSLWKKGINKMAQKVGEEAVEVVIEAKDDNIDLFKNEAADLLFHYILLLKAKNVTLSDIETVLVERHNK